MPASTVQDVIDAYGQECAACHFAAYNGTLTMFQAYQGSSFALDKDRLLRGIKARVQSAALPEIDGDDTLSFMVQAPQWYS